jgi:hypothetical protein
VIVPEPAASSVTDDPPDAVTSLFSSIDPLVPACSVTAPDAEIAVARVILPVILAVSMRLNTALVALLETVTALESEIYTLPVVLTISVGVLTRIAPVAPLIPMVPLAADSVTALAVMVGLEEALR